MIERKLRCPYCGRINDLHAELSGDDAPEEGDGSICWSCYGVARFSADGGLRALEGEELEEARRLPEVRAALAVIREAYTPAQALGLLRRGGTS